MPSRLQRMVFGNGFVIDVINPRLQLTTAEEERREAMRQAREPGGYRFELPDPFAIRVDETADGTLRWREAR